MSSSSHGTPREIALREGLRVWAEVDLDRVAANVRALDALAGEARLLAVVKGNAYGHGAVAVGREAIAAGAWGLGVVGVDEGEELRRAGIDAPILVLGSSSAAMAPRIVENDLRVVVGSFELGQALSDVAAQSGRKAIVHIKVETGLNRFGLEPQAVLALAKKLRGLPGVVVEGLATHLASVDEGDKSFTHQQFEAFRACADQLSWIPLHHVASTGAVLDLPEMCLGLVRCGIGVYGYYPSDEVQRRVELQPVLSLRSRVARVAVVEAGASVGYGRGWTAQRRSTVALVMAGYADGIRRSLSNQGVALVQGRRAPYAGRVAMDMLMLDVTDIPRVAVDDEVTLIGEQAGDAVTADDLARRAGTISYELLAGVMARVPRLFLRQGCIVARQDLSGYRDATAP